MLAPKLDQIKKQEALARAQQEFGQSWSKPKPLAKAFQALTEKPAGKVYSLDPWLLARYLPQLEKTALNSLNREGLIGWYPTYKDVRPTPLSRIPPKKRDQADKYMDEVRKALFPGYILIKRIFGCFDINRLFDLEGCGSIVTVGGCVAHIPDFDVEIMRLAEAYGSFDRFSARGSTKPYRLTRLPEGMDRRWTDQADRLVRLDESGRTSLFVDASGRIARYIASADPV